MTKLEENIFSSSMDDDLAESTDGDEATPTFELKKDQEVISPAAAVARLRKSRSAFRDNLFRDARATGWQWLDDLATYQQIRYLAMTGEKDGFEDALKDPEPARLFDGIEEAIEGLSSVPEWCRDEEWMVEFLKSAVERWFEISDDVETAG